jgi:tetratricopeptide (TPR) repeat protein
MGARFIPGVATPLAFSLLLSVACYSVGTTTVILYNDQGRYTKAIEVAKQVIDENPSDAEAHFQLGLSYSHLDSTAAAYRHFTTALELDPRNTKRREMAENNIQHNFTKHYTIGQSEFRHGGMASAVGAFEKATAADPRRAVGFYNLGVVYSRLAESEPGFRDDAASAFEEAVRRSTPNDDFHKAALAALMRNHAAGEDWESAARWGERYVALDASNPDVWRQLSLCHERQGNAERAKECLARSQALVPSPQG